MQPNGDMLRLARQRRGFQQTDAARRLKVDQSLLSRMENGVAEIREELLLSAAALYEVPQSFFYQTAPIYGAPVSVHPMWRRKADVTVRDVDAIVAELNVRTMHLRKFLEAADVARAHDLPRLDIEDYGDPEEIARMRFPAALSPSMTRAMPSCTGLPSSARTSDEGSSAPA